MEWSPELELQKQKDMHVIESLRTLGSDMSKPHEIEHHFVTESKECAEALHAWARDHGFRVSELLDIDYEGRHDWYFDIIRPTVPAIEAISADTSLMLSLAEEFGVEYDGWGCLIEP